MNIEEFLNYLKEDLLLDAEALRLVQNILEYARDGLCDENEQFNFLCQMLEGVCCLSENDIKAIYL